MSLSSGASSSSKLDSSAAPGNNGSAVIPVGPLQLSGASPDHQANPRIVRPTPRRPQQLTLTGKAHTASANATSSAAGVDSGLLGGLPKPCWPQSAAGADPDCPNKSLTDPVLLRTAADKAKTEQASAAGHVRVKSLSPKFKHKAHNVVNIFQAREGSQSSSSPREQSFVTSVLIEKPSSTATTGTSEDSGFQILSSKDEEAERSGSVGRTPGNNGHDHRNGGSAATNGGPGQLNNQRYKPRRRKPLGNGNVSIHHNSAAIHDHIKKTNVEAQSHIFPVQSGSGASGNIHHLLDVKAAIERLQLQDPDGNDSDSSLASGSSSDSCQSSASSGGGVPGDAASSSTHPMAAASTTVTKSVARSGVKSTSSSRLRHKKNLSQETLNTTVTSADEFVWIDSHNRLVELQQLPWTVTDLNAVLSRCLEEEGAIDKKTAADVLPRMSYYLQRLLVRLSREAQRLSKELGKCGKREIASSIKVVLAPSLATNAIKACLRSVAMFAMSGDDTHQSKSSRASLTLQVGRMHQWMCLVKVGRLVHEHAAIYLCAAVESVLEELIQACLGMASAEAMLTSTILEQVVACNGDFWGLFQPYAHLSSSRIASGTLSLSPAVDQLLTGGAASSVHQQQQQQQQQPQGKASAGHSKRGSDNVRQILLTTCVGSVDELEEMVLIAGSIFAKVWQQSLTTAASVRPTSSMSHHSRPASSAGAAVLTGISWCPEALRCLYHYMRCSQLEYVGQDGRSPIQELVYERPYIVLPPILEWVRVCAAFAEHRAGTVLQVDSEDVQQAARILLPGMDCPPRSVISPGTFTPRFTSLGALDDKAVLTYSNRLLACQLLLSGRREWIPQALKIADAVTLEEKRLITNTAGLTPLQISALRGDSSTVRSLIEAGFDINDPGHVTNEQSHCGWTPLTFAAISGHVKVVKVLLERGATSLPATSNTESPLQVAAGAGNLRVVELLLGHGASPFADSSISLAGNEKEAHSYLPAAPTQAACCPPVSVAASHGHRRVLHSMMTQCLAQATKQSQQLQTPGTKSEDEVLSLEEILAEGLSGPAAHKDSHSNAANASSTASKAKSDSLMAGLNKAQVKRLQEAMYHAAESAHLELSLDLRNLSVPWPLYTWIQTLRVAHTSHLLPVINELLQDFTSDWVQESSQVFVDTGLPLLFSIFKSCKNESTLLMLADIFSVCYGRQSIQELQDIVKKKDEEEQLNAAPASSGPRIDPKFVNNSELSDVQFRVEGRIYYAHKLVLVTASPRFKSMLKSRFCDSKESLGSGSPSSAPVLQINDIRYDIFHLVMTYLYKGGSNQLNVGSGDVLELMAAANFFQLAGLLRHCELLCSRLVDLDNIVSYYIHAKVYAALSLLEFCQGFLLSNLVALLTYDEAVKRLLFGKKAQANHEVLDGLLAHLQAKIRDRRK